MDTSFSNRLFLLPLFQGFSRLDFLDIVEKTPFAFQTLNKDEALVHQNESCESLCMILSGNVETDVDSPDHSYHFFEKMSAPWIVQPERLFGYHNRYSCTVRALSEVQIVVLEKQAVRQLLIKYPVFQINFYNLISTAAQNANEHLWFVHAKTLQERFKHFLHIRSLLPSGEKALHIKMEDLALELGTTRLAVSRMLAKLSAEKLVCYSRGLIYIDGLEKL